MEHDISRLPYTEFIADFRKICTYCIGLNIKMNQATNLLTVHTQTNQLINLFEFFFHF